ncbi:MAG: helix-turn-helix transcriptional regulator [Parvularculaceae bacterium]|nr:helix-turn-helix transcriptional regulator [Parvularculaceae bacterium]
MDASEALCEAVDLSPGLAATARRWEVPATADELARFPHFHDPCELNWFRSISGTLHTQAGDQPISSGDVVFIPSMAFHDFSLNRGTRSWVLVYIDASVVADLFHQRSKQVPSQPTVWRPDDEMQARLANLFDWIADLQQTPDDTALSHHLVNGLVTSIIPHLGETEPKSVASPSMRRRLRPALDLVANNTRDSIPVEAAASQCHLSREYFSRTFKATFGVGFSEYVRNYRLRRAARQLSQTDFRISDIAFDNGFQSPSHFTACFRDSFGTPPTEFRRSSQSRERA